MAKFHVNFNFSIIVFCTFLFNTLIMASLEMPSINGAMHSFGKLGIDLVEKLKQQFHEFITPSNSNIFLIPKTKSTFSCISDTSVYI